ncbi:hypothetical protein BZG36_04788 [Bifiguratus adelaidae]|uniref:Gamma-secretase subunit Aph-1 n=1 Tax=Bifiguratus adelaidae TaxID=1938954 RepID=A0A261XUB5_9FUNG|nr:hypothetical protein BZG36_04788 [Bifiguratus adelaidae]
MTLISFFACLFTAYGPALAIFFLYIARDAQLVLLMLSSAFFWLIAILLSSVIWYLAKSVQSQNYVTIIFTVLLQEVFRYLFYRLIRRAEVGLNLVSKHPKSVYNRSAFAFVSGYGFGLMSGAVMYMSVLVASLGSGALICPSCPQIDMYFVNAITCSLFIFQHILWMVLAFDGLSSPNFLMQWFMATWVVVSHLGASFATLFNASTIPNGCVYSILINIAIIGVSGGLAVHSLIRS